MTSPSPIVLGTLPILVVVGVSVTCLAFLVQTYRVFGSHIQRVLRRERGGIWMDAQVMLVQAVDRDNRLATTRTFITLLTIQRIAVQEVVDRQALLRELDIAFATRTVVPDCLNDGHRWPPELLEVLRKMARGLWLIAVCEPHTFSAMVRVGSFASLRRVLGVIHADKDLPPPPRTLDSAWQYCALIQYAERFGTLACTPPSAWIRSALPTTANNANLVS